MGEITCQDRALIGAIQKGLPLVSHPYEAIGKSVGMSESEVIERIGSWIADGTIKRMGVVVRHHELGYRDNAMVVWDVPDDRVSELGRRFGNFEFVTLSYRRRRCPPRWPYNLFCMIHGRDRDTVLRNLASLEEACNVREIPHEVLFSRRRFKQRGAHYARRRDEQGDNS